MQRKPADPRWAHTTGNTDSCLTKRTRLRVTDPGVTRFVTRWTLAVAAILATPMVGFAQPAEVDQSVSSNDPVFVVNKPESQTQITEKFSKVIQLPQRISRVDGFDPVVLNVTALSATSFRLQALTPGVTTVVFTDEFGAVYTVEAFVAGDVRHLQAYIDRLFPGSAVKAVAVQDSVVLRGWVTRPEEITKIVEIAERFYPHVLNQMYVGGMQQVILKCRVMEVQRSKIRQLGMNFLYVNDNGFVGSTPGTLVPLSNSTANFTGNGAGGQGLEILNTALSSLSLAGGIVDDNNIFQTFLDALKQERLLKILAEPTLNTTNGRPAQMLAGGEFPIVVPQSLGTTTIEWREFGVRMEAVPTILGAGRVRLELQPEVSERDFSNSVNINGFTVPGLTTRRVNTQVEMKFGQTYMLAGLLSLRRTATTSKIPFLGELPWIGAAFRRVQYDEGETELVILVTPELAGPLDPYEVPAGGPGLSTDVPTDRELYRDGFIEVPNYGGVCPDCEPTGAGVPFSRMHYSGAEMGDAAMRAAPVMEPAPQPIGPSNPVYEPAMESAPAQLPAMEPTGTVQPVHPQPDSAFELPRLGVPTPNDAVQPPPLPTTQRQGRPNWQPTNQSPVVPAGNQYATPQRRGLITPQ